MIWFCIRTFDVINCANGVKSELFFNYFSLRTYTALSILSIDGLYVSGYFLIRKYFFADLKIPRPYVSVFKANLPFPARIRLVSGFTLVPRTPLGKLATKLSMRRKAREIWPIQPGRSQKNAKSKVDSSTGKREEAFVLNRVFTVKNWARSYYVTG